MRLGGRLHTLGFSIRQEPFLIFEDSTTGERRELGFARPRLCRPLKQYARLNVQNRRQLVDHIDRCTVHAPFKRADIGAIDLSLMGQRLLRQPLRVSSLPQIAGEDLSYMHAREASALSCISPRSMLDKNECPLRGISSGVSMLEQRSELKRDQPMNTNLCSTYSPAARLCRQPPPQGCCRKSMDVHR